MEYQIGLILVRTGQQGLAIERFRRSGDLIRQIVGPDHMSVTIPLFDMGVALRMNKQIDEAEAAFKECLRVVRLTVGMIRLKIVTRRFDDATVLLDQYGNLSELSEENREK